MTPRTLFLLAFWLCLLACFSLQAKEVKVGIIGDQSGSQDLAQSYQVLAQAIDILKKEQVDLVLHVGDLLESTKKNSAIRHDFQIASTLLATLPVPWYITPGDHDVNPGDWRVNSPNRAKESLFRELLLPKISALPKDENRLYYSFDYHGYHFIALNALEHLHADPRWGNVFLARLSDAQIAWLKTDLHDHQDATGILVFLHQPLWYNQAGWLAVHRLLREYGVKAVIAGHFHYDQDDGEIDGIRYLVIGATGAAIKRANPASGNMHQVAIMHLNEGTLSPQLFDVATGKKTDWTPRADADRVQALDYMLDAVSGFTEHKPLFLHKNGLVNDCRNADSHNKQTAQIRLGGLGNPIDLPVRLSLFTNSDHVAFAHPYLIEKTCAIENNSLQCELPPGSGIAVSNSASASACFPSCPRPAGVACLRQCVQSEQRKAPPFWSVGLRSVGQGEKMLGEQVLFRLELSFAGQHGPMVVFREFRSAPLSSCE